MDMYGKGCLWWGVKGIRGTKRAGVVVEVGKNQARKGLRASLLERKKGSRR